MTKTIKTNARPDNTSAVTHGAYAFRARGLETLDETGRSYHAELTEMVQTRPGVVELMQRNLVDACQIVALLNADVVAKAAGGKPIDEIGALHMLAVYMNSAQRQLTELYKVLPQEERGITAAVILKSINGGDNDNSE